MGVIFGWRHVVIPGLGLRVHAPRSAAAAPALWVEDSFTAANGTNLHGRTPDVSNTPGNTWAAVVQSWSIISNRARGTDYAYSVAVIECGAADGTITMPLGRGMFRNGIVFRYVDTDNYWFAHYSAVDGMCIYERTSGSDTQRAQVSPTDAGVATGTLTLSGNNITFAWSDGLLNHTSAVRNAATKHGIMRQDFADSGIADWWKMD